MRNRLASFAFAAAMSIGLLTLFAVVADTSRPALSQQGGNPTFIPTSLVPSTTLAAPGNVVMQTNGCGTSYVRVLGTNTGVAATIQGTEARAGTPTWSSMGTVLVGGARIGTITGNGLYRVNSAGFAQIRLNLTAISTGSILVTMSCSPGPEFIAQLPQTRYTYSFATTGLATAASATDFLTLIGSATTTIRINYVACSGIASTVGTADIVALKRSTADTGGTSTAPTLVPHDSSNPAATAVAAAYTVNPTTGTLVGNMRTGKLGLPLANTGAGADKLVWYFGGERPGSQEIVLRGVAQQFALNGAGATLAAGAALDCSVEFSEE